MFIVAAMLLVMGLWCLYDAYVMKNFQYPEDGNVNGVAKYYFNHWGGFMFTIGGLIPLTMGLLFLRRHLVADGEGIDYPGQGKVAWKDVKRLDATDLADKGILRLEYGGDKPLVLDSWKLQNFKALVAFVEAHVPADAIDTGEKA